MLAKPIGTHIRVCEDLNRCGTIVHPLTQSSDLFQMLYFTRPKKHQEVLVVEHTNWLHA